MSNNYYWEGVMSEAAPNEKDLELDKRLDVCLRKFEFFESEEESTKREIVLAKIDKIVKEFIKKVSLEKNFSEGDASEAGGKIFTLGSYRLGVHQKGADIDTLVLAPKQVTREDFFSVLYDMLSQRQEVTNLSKVIEAHTPIMKMTFSGIEIDLLFATLSTSSIPENIDLSDINILRNLDDKSIRSLNGPRVADALLSLVPKVQVYRAALCAIKLWAQRRGIYSNVMGYLGGVAWALMTARICQFYPKACAATVVMKFFKVYKEWKWPNPVTLRPIEEVGLNLKSWNPRIATRKEMMPIITPAAPSMNSSYNVSASTFSLMKEEIIRGSEVSTEIEEGKKKWEDLFEESDFFTKFKHYIQLLATTTTSDCHSNWKGFVESRVRTLIQCLEKTPNILSAPPYPDSFYQEITVGEGEAAKKVYQSSFFFGLNVSEKSNAPNAEKRSIDLTAAVEEFNECLQVHKTSEMESEIKYIKKKDVPDMVFKDKKKKKTKRVKKVASSSLVPSGNTNGVATTNSNPNGNTNTNNNSSNSSHPPQTPSATATTATPEDKNSPKSPSSAERKAGWEESDTKRTKVIEGGVSMDLSSSEVYINESNTIDFYDTSNGSLTNIKRGEVDEIDAVSVVSQPKQDKKADIKLKLQSS